MLQSAIVIELPRTGALVDVRQRFARDARVGVPPHITVLFPFVGVSRLDAHDLARLTETVKVVPAFGFALTQTRWFGESVLWLAPDDPEPFLTLMRTVAAAFPQCVPYGGAHDRVVPHATVGDAASPEELRAAEQCISGALPLYGRATEVSLLVEADDGRWSVRERFPLAPSLPWIRERLP